MPLATNNQALVREILRTLGRMHPTHRVQAYWHLISELAVEIYGRNAMGEFVHEGPSQTSAILRKNLGPARLNELKGWLQASPQYVFSMIVGLAQNDDDDLAWAFAYG